MPKFVICGMEHSGTTLISDLFRQVPGIDAGFEVGVLLCPSPKEFEGFDPFFTNMIGGWKLTKEELAEACHAANFDGFYARVQALSKVLQPGTTDIIDKTPRYFSRLDDCMNRADVPFIASFKDPRSIVFSDFRRSQNDDFDAWYPDYLEPKHLYVVEECYQNYQKARARNEGKVAFVALEALCMDTRATCERLFKHVGLEFKTEYMILEDQRHGDPRPNGISPRLPFEYKKHLTDGQQRRIMDDFAECGDWFYE